MREHVLGEGIATARLDRLALRRCDWLGGHAKWQLRDHQPAKGVAWYVHAFPERRRAEQDGLARLAEPREQGVARLVAVHEQRPAALDPARAQLVRELAHFPMAREQHEQPTVRRLGDVEHDA